jgi:FkbM family methyltransferase
LKTRLVHGRLDVKYYVVDGRDLISNTLRRQGVYEAELLEATASALQNLAAKPEDVRGRVLDVGANLGSYALPMAKAYPGLELVCFEPQPLVCDLLRKNIELNQLSNVVTHALALSDSAGEVTATLPEYELEPNIGAFSLDEEVQAHDYEVKTRGATQTVQLRTLDSFDFREVRMLKVDVEGLELSVLRGGQQTLVQNGFPPLLFEAWTWKPWYAQRRRELIAWVEALGYRVRSFGAFNNLAQHPKHRKSLA